MQTIMTRFSTIVRAEVTSLIDRFEDPEKILHQLILDMEEALADARRGAGRAIADETRLRGRCEHHEVERVFWEARAAEAIERGDEPSARAALDRAERHQEQAKGLREQHGKQKADTERLRDAVRDLASKIEEAKARRNLLLARLQRARAQKEIYGTLNGLGERSAFRALERMGDRVEQLEAEACAEALLLGDAGDGEGLRRELAEVERARRVEARLLEMRQGCAQGRECGEGAHDRVIGSDGRSSE